MHILFLNSWYPSKVFPTNGNFIKNHAQAIATQHNVTAIHVVSSKNQTEKIKLEHFSKKEVTTWIGYVKYTSNPIVKYLRFFKAYKSILHKTTPFDVVHLNRLYPLGIIALYLKWFKKIPFIISEHFTGYLELRKNNLGFAHLLLAKTITKNAAFVCPVSKNLGMSMKKMGMKGHYHPIPNVIDTEIFYPKPKQNRIFKLTHISRMEDCSKNITGMLQVVKILEDCLDNFEFTFVGDAAHQYTSTIEKLGIQQKHIQLMGRVSEKEVAALLQQSDVMVLFSNYENLPCVILEAFACGIPVITSNVGGIAEYFPTEFGILVPPKNNEALLKAILEISVKKTKNATQMHAYSKEKFGIQAVATKFTKLYNHAIEPN